MTDALTTPNPDGSSDFIFDENGDLVLDTPECRARCCGSCVCYRKVVACPSQFIPGECGTSEGPLVAFTRCTTRCPLTGLPLEAGDVILLNGFCYQVQPEEWHVTGCGGPDYPYQFEFASALLFDEGDFSCVTDCDDPACPREAGAYVVGVPCPGNTSPRVPFLCLGQITSCEVRSLQEIGPGSQPRHCWKFDPANAVPIPPPGAEHVRNWILFRVYRGREACCECRAVCPQESTTYGLGCSPGDEQTLTCCCDGEFEWVGSGFLYQFRIERVLPPTSVDVRSYGRCSVDEFGVPCPDGWCTRRTLNGVEIERGCVSNPMAPQQGCTPPVFAVSIPEVGAATGQCEGWVGLGQRVRTMQLGYSITCDQATFDIVRVVENYSDAENTELNNIDTFRQRITWTRRRIGTASQECTGGCTGSTTPTPPPFPPGPTVPPTPGPPRPITAAGFLEGL